MALARWQRTIVDDEGNIVEDANIEVRLEVPGAPLASLYSDRNGTLNIGNPFLVASEAFAAFHVIGGAYKIRAYNGTFERIWRYVAIGTSAEQDAGTAFFPRGAWSAVDTYAIGDMVSDSDGGDPYAFVSNEDDNLNNAPPFTSGGIGTSNSHWTVLGLIESPGAPGVAGSSDVTGSSITNLAIATGAKVFTIVENDRGWAIGARLRASSIANPDTHWMEGIVTDYSANTLDLLVDLSEGSGSRADWSINLSGEQGEPGQGLTMYGSPAGGTADAITAVASLTRSIHVFKAASANTGAATFNGRPIKDKDGAALLAGAIQPDIYYFLLDDTVNYYLIASGAIT